MGQASTVLRRNWIGLFRPFPQDADSVLVICSMSAAARAFIESFGRRGARLCKRMARLLVTDQEHRFRVCPVEVPLGREQKLFVYKPPPPLSLSPQQPRYNAFCPHPILLRYPRALLPVSPSSGRRLVRGQFFASLAEETLDRQLFAQ